MNDMSEQQRAARSAAGESPDTAGLDEALSALMDGEATEVDINRVLTHIPDARARATWMRYQGISRALQGDGGPLIDLSGPVMAAVNAGQPLVARTGFRARISRRMSSVRVKSLLRPTARFALAASVFALVLAGSRLAGLFNTPPADLQSPVARLPGPEWLDTQSGSARTAGYNEQLAHLSLAAATTDYNGLARQQLQGYLLMQSGQLVPNTARDGGDERLSLLANIDGGAALASGAALAIARSEWDSWRLEWLPAGFVRADDAQGAAVGKTFSDGLARFTVVVEFLPGLALAGEGRARRGSTIAYTRALQLAGRPALVTVLGEVPVDTARRLADAVRWGAVDVN